MYKVINSNNAIQVDQQELDWIINDKVLKDLSIDKNGKRELNINHQGKEYVVRVHEFIQEEKKLILFINGKRQSFQVKEPIDLFLAKVGIDTFAKKKAKNIKAPMPGLILKVLVKAGEEVSAGDPLLILEAMKMENVFKAPDTVKIKSILIKEGQAVDKNQELILFE